MTAAGWILASQSPRRAALLRAAGMDFAVRPSDVDESLFAQGSPRAVALQTSMAKAEAVAEAATPGSLIIAADTIVVLDREIFNKPRDRAQALEMHRRLAGRAHTVVTGLCVMRAGGEAYVDAVAADVHFYPWDETLVRDYLASGEADDKAGAYGIQGLGARFVAAVEGDITTVIGLPMARLREMAFSLTPHDCFGGRSIRQIAREAFPDLAQLPEACLRGTPDAVSRG